MSREFQAPGELGVIIVQDESSSRQWQIPSGPAVSESYTAASGAALSGSAVTGGAGTGAPGISVPL